MPRRQRLLSWIASNVHGQAERIGLCWRRAPSSGALVIDCKWICGAIRGWSKGKLGCVIQAGCDAWRGVFRAGRAGSVSAVSESDIASAEASLKRIVAESKRKERQQFGGMFGH